MKRLPTLLFALAFSLPAFAAYAAPDCTFPDTQPEKLHGVEAVTARLAGTPDGMTLTWSPAFASASASGDLGYTWGRYEARIPTANGPVLRTGHYTTIWRRQPNGDWKYVLDTGNPDPPKK